MSEKQPDIPHKIQSPYPGLQTLLPRLRALNAGDEESRAIFDNRAKAQLFIDIQQQQEGRALMLTPVWRIDHANLIASKIRGWSATRYPC